MGRLEARMQLGVTEGDSTPQRSHLAPGGAEDTWLEAMMSEEEVEIRGREAENRA